MNKFKYIEEGSIIFETNSLIEFVFYLTEKADKVVLRELLINSIDSKGHIVELETRI